MTPIVSWLLDSEKKLLVRSGGNFVREPVISDASWSIPGCKVMVLEQSSCTPLKTTFAAPLAMNCSPVIGARKICICITSLGTRVFEKKSSRPSDATSFSKNKEPLFHHRSHALSVGA